MWYKCSRLCMFSVCLGYVHLCLCIWRIKVNSECLSQSLGYLYFLRQCLHRVCNSLICKIGFFCLHLPNVEKPVMCCHSQLFCMGAENRNSAPQACSYTSTTPTETTFWSLKQFLLYFHYLLL